MHPFTPVEPTDRPGHYRFTVPKNLCVGPPDRLFMFGGVGLASALSAVEHFTGRPTVWAAAQYLSYARPGTELDLEVIVPVTGKYNSQARVITRAGDQEIITVNAALGSRPDSPHHQWAVMPAVPPLTSRLQRRPFQLISVAGLAVTDGGAGIDTGAGVGTGCAVAASRRVSRKPIKPSTVCWSGRFQSPGGGMKPTTTKTLTQVTMAYN